MTSDITDSKELIIISLTKFFSNKQHLNVLLAHISTSENSGNEKSTSLRVIDWFVTNYAKKHAIVINMDTHRHFNVYVNYRSQLKAYSKHQFDPFRRRFRINYYYNEEKFVETTIGQLNFFKWLIENNILDYIKAHHAEIEVDMIHSTQKKEQCPAGEDGAAAAAASGESACSGSSSSSSGSHHNAATLHHNQMNHTVCKREISFF